MVNEGRPRTVAITLKNFRRVKIYDNEISGFDTAIDAEDIGEAHIENNRITGPAAPPRNRIRNWLLGGVSMAAITKAIGLS